MHPNCFEKGGAKYFVRTDSAIQNQCHIVELIWSSVVLD